MESVTIHKILILVRHSAIKLVFIASLKTIYVNFI